VTTNGDDVGEVVLTFGDEDLLPDIDYVMRGER
jgi:hypothetical protein